MAEKEIDESERWLLSFYRTSEIGGALFFGRLARSMRPGQIQSDMTKHFSDEAQHAWYWTECMNRVGANPLSITDNYQDQYSAEVGVPANMMEVLAITHVFEKRVVNQYSKHASIDVIHPVVKETILKIMKDEKWHLEWIRKALDGLEKDYGADEIEKTLKRFTEADEKVYQATMKEHEDRLQHIIERNKKLGLNK